MEKEIYWEEVSGEEFKAIVPGKELEKLQRTSIKFETLPSGGMNVYYDDPTFLDGLEEKFVLSEFVATFPVLIFTKYNSRKHNIVPKYSHSGYVQDDGQNVLIFGSSFGLLKSVVSGFASYLLARKSFVPVHASVASFNDRGFMFIGGHAAGKTTTLFHLINFAKERKQVFKILTDDWAVVQFSNGVYSAKTFDSSVSLTKQLFDQYPLLFPNKKKLLKRIGANKKISINPNEVYEQDVSSSLIKVQTAIIMDPQVGKPCLHALDSGEFARYVTESAYHYPYTQDGLINNHIAFWEKYAECFDVYRFCTRCQEGKHQSLHPIEDLLTISFG